MLCKQKGVLFNGLNGLIYFALMLVLMYYLGSYLQGKIIDWFDPDAGSDHSLASASHPQGI